MILPDVNVLVHAVNVGVAQHVTARAALQDAFESDQVALAWAAMLGFLRLTTRPGILARPLPVEAALDMLRRWSAHPSALVIQPTTDHASVLSRLLLGLGQGQGGNIVSDAHLAALAIEHGATLLTFDRDFDRFTGLKVKRLK